MPLAIEDAVKEALELLARQDVQRAMEIRCDEQGHDFEGYCTVLFQIYQRCKWCGYAK